MGWETEEFMWVLVFQRVRVGHPLPSQQLDNRINDRPNNLLAFTVTLTTLDQHNPPTLEEVSGDAAIP